MDRWTGCFKVSLNPSKATSCIKVTASLMFSPSSNTLMMPSMNAIFFNGDKVQGTGNSVIERLSDARNIAELLVAKLGCSANVWVVEASTYNGPFAVYKEFIHSVTSRGEPKRYDPSGFPASSAIVAILSRCFEQVPSNASSKLTEQRRENAHAPTLSPTPIPKTIILGFSKGGTVVNQLVTEFAHLKASPQFFDRRQGQFYPTSKDELLLSVSEFHYIDVGLNCTGAYLTDHSVIKKIAEHLLLNNAGVRFVIHGTPRQWFDHHRPWIRREKDIMLQMLKDEAHRCEEKLQIQCITGDRKEHISKQQSPLERGLLLTQLPLQVIPYNLAILQHGNSRIRSTCFAFFFVPIVADLWPSLRPLRRVYANAVVPKSGIKLLLSRSEGI